MIVPVPVAVYPKCCTNLYQEREKVPSLENASTTPMEMKLFLVMILVGYGYEYLSLHYILYSAESFLLIVCFVAKFCKKKFC